MALSIVLLVVSLLALLLLAGPVYVLLARLTGRRRGDFAAVVNDCGCESPSVRASENACPPRRHVDVRIIE